jgi:hypothetical protein
MIVQTNVALRTTTAGVPGSIFVFNYNTLITDLQSYSGAVLLQSVEVDFAPLAVAIVSGVEQSCFVQLYGVNELESDYIPMTPAVPLSNANRTMLRFKPELHMVDWRLTTDTSTCFAIKTFNVFSGSAVALPINMEITCVFRRSPFDTPSFI